MRAFVVIGLVFPYQAKRFAWTTSPNLLILCRVGHKTTTQLECGPMPNVMAALANIGGALCSKPQSLVDAHRWSVVQ